MGEIHYNYTTFHLIRVFFYLNYETPIFGPFHGVYLGSELWNLY